MSGVSDADVLKPDATRVAVTGANGLLGQKLVALFRAMPGMEVFGSGMGDPAACIDQGAEWTRLDVMNRDAVIEYFCRLRPFAVIHAGALTDVDGCEDRRLEAMAVNAEGTGHVAYACAETGAKMVYVSTEYVFDGSSGPYSEEDDPCPVSVYANSKYEGEIRAVAMHGNLAICRTTVLYGCHCRGGLNFATWLIRELKAGRSVRIVADQIGSPTFADNLAEMLAAVALSDRRGVYNTAGADVLSRYEFALKIASEFGLDAGLIRPIATSELGQKANRPLRAGLLMDKFRSHFPNVPVMGVGEALQLLKRQMSGPRN